MHGMVTILYVNYRVGQQGDYLAYLALFKFIGQKCFDLFSGSPYAHFTSNCNLMSRSWRRTNAPKHQLI